VAMFQPNSRSITRHTSRKQLRVHWTTAKDVLCATTTRMSYVSYAAVPVLGHRLAQSLAVLSKGGSTSQRRLFFLRAVGRSLGSQPYSGSRLSELAIAIA